MKMTHIGDNIKRIRKESGISQQELAERCEVSKSQISRMESGEQTNPQIQTVVAIATALSASLDEIVFGESPETMTYMSKAIDELPENDRATLKKLIRGWMLISHTEKLEKEK
jgi:transcriptional regulator with XRE-family HTH domain